LEKKIIFDWEAWYILENIFSRAIRWYAYMFNLVELHRNYGPPKLEYNKLS